MDSHKITPPPHSITPPPESPLSSFYYQYNRSSSPSGSVSSITSSSYQSTSISPPFQHVNPHPLSHMPVSGLGFHMYPHATNNNNTLLYQHHNNITPTSSISSSPKVFSSTDLLLDHISPCTSADSTFIKQEPSTSKISKSASSKKKPSQKSKTPRSRFGCEECKSKRIKCDEIKPHCSRCISKGLTCRYKIILQFREDLELRGKKFGREGVWSKNKKQDSGSGAKTTQLVKRSQESYYATIRNLQKLQFINTGYSDINRVFMPPMNITPMIVPSLQSSIIPPDITRSLKDPNSLNFALNYYIEFISPILNPVGDQSIYYNQLSDDNSRSIVVEKGLDLSALVKYSQNNTSLFYLILSLGSIYLSKLNGIAQKAGWLSKAKYFQDLGLAKIQPEIDRLVSDTDINNSSHTYTTDLLVALVLLILYEFANDCDRQWTIYLKLCKKLINSEKFVLPYNSLEYSLLKFCLEFLNYQESIGRTACKDVNSFFLQLEEEEEEKTGVVKAPNQITLVSWMGCDRRLLNIISDITDLSFERFRNSISETNYAILCNDMKKKLDEMNINVMEAALASTNHNETTLMVQEFGMEIEEFCFLLSCEIKRLATILYLESCLLNKTPEDESITRLVRQIFKLLEFIVIKNDYKWYSTLIWSVFMASSEISSVAADCEDLRYLTLQIMDKLEDNTLGNVGKTRQIILSIWKRRDLDNCDENSFGVINDTTKKNKKRGLMGWTNDWEKYVVDEDYAIALA
ncbi:uncharacterized protein J8A68_001137 [[Candida] subhashii]|uniref:Zn(2)-C6 fungal-type domain-containing protein n=1 Tax=[Candida] subhashii TaxID=561895 RepID=A0A8J5V4W7_9ASCO|nr:uncharacterized protein J8A68_001137 [[Candida] subhashii]KAG7665449.1 hypothetical protein J8A68_001137 [[Candida] subhashii]